MSDPSRQPSVAAWAALAAALLAIPVLWFYRGVVPLDVAARLVLPIGWLALWSIACLGAGLLLCRLVVGAGEKRSVVVVVASGAALHAWVGALLASCGLFRPVILNVLLVTTAVVGLFWIWRGREALTLELPSQPRAGLVLAAAAAGVVGLTLTAPPVMYDALNYHLAFPDRWLQHGGFIDFPRHYYSYYPAAGGVLFAHGLAAVGPWAAKALHWWFGVVAALAAAGLGRRLAGPRAGGWALLCFALTPAVLEVAGYAIVDLAVAAWGGAALLALVDEARSGRGLRVRSCVLVGILVGSAAATKYLALATVVAPVVVAVLVVSGRGRDPRRRVACASAMVLAVGVVLMPWLVRNAVWTGNPLYPYFAGVLGGDPSPTSIAGEMGQNQSAAGGLFAYLGQVAAGPVVRTFRPLQVGAVLGPLWLILLPTAVFLRGVSRSHRRPLWIVTILGLVAWSSLVQFGRFLLPVLVPAAALAGAAAAALTASRSRAVRGGFAAVLGAALVWNATTLANPMTGQQLAVSVGADSEMRFLSSWVSYWPVVPSMRSALPVDSCVLLVGESRAFAVPGSVIVEDPYRRPWLIELAAESSSALELAETVRSRGATHVLVNELEMDRIAEMRGLPGYWAEADERERRLIDLFFSDHVAPRIGSPPVWVGEITAFEPVAGARRESRTAPGGRAGSRER